MKSGNVLVLLSDEHNADIMGCAGHPIVKTPHLDALAQRGTRFTSAYTPSPICVPARASIATGRYVHEHRCWDNAIAYDGRTPSWGHRLHEAQVPVESIGKLHYRKEEDPTGFDRQQLPVHIMNGIGQVFGSVRDPLPQTIGTMPLFDKIGAGESSYNRFDRNVTELAIKWLKGQEQAATERPWVLFVGLVAPHFPLIVPQTYLDLYPLGDIPLPRLLPKDGYVRHPWVERQVRYSDHDAAVGSDERKRLAVATYYALTTFMDEQIGKIMAALDSTRFASDTTIVYSSDHGDNMGVRGTWNKCLLYKESTAIPLIVCGPEVPAAKTCSTAATLVDLYPTIIEATGISVHPDDQDLPGKSLTELAKGAEDTSRFALSEYHAIGSDSAGYMIADARYKYHEYVGYPAELFDLKQDPGETTNLATLPEYQSLVDDYAAKLRTLLDPAATDARAKRDQAALVASFGGREKALATGTPGATPVPTR
jgi:choline-sulfatase